MCVVGCREGEVGGRNGAAGVMRGGGNVEGKGRGMRKWGYEEGECRGRGLGLARERRKREQSQMKNERKRGGKKSVANDLNERPW